MEDSQIEKNPVTVSRNRSESFWQITVPVILTTSAFVIPIVVLLIGNRYEELAVFSDYIIVLLIFGLLIAGLPIILLVIFLNDLLRKGVTGVPSSTFKGQKFFEKIRDNVDAFTDKIAGKIIQSRSLQIGLTAIIGNDKEEILTTDEGNEVVS